MNREDAADVIEYHVYKQMFDEVYESTENYGRTQFVDEIVKLKKQLSQTERNNQAMQEEMARCWDKLYHKNDKINKIIDYVDSSKFSEQFENVGNEDNVRKHILEILDEENK